MIVGEIIAHPVRNFLGQRALIFRVDLRQGATGRARAHGLDQQMARHLIDSPAVLPRKLFQALNDHIVQIADNDLVHGNHRATFPRRSPTNRRIVSFYPAPINSSHSCSEIIFTPSSWAFLSFEPAPGPATIRSVFFDTEPATFAPKDSARAFASFRLIFSRVPVKTMILPPTAESAARWAATSAISICSSRWAIASPLCESRKNAW